MRVFVAAGSVLLLVVAAALFSFDNEWALEWNARHKKRSWWRFVTTLFTGELLYEAFYGGKAAEETQEVTKSDAVDKPSCAESTVVDRAR